MANQGLTANNKLAVLEQRLVNVERMNWVAFNSMIVFCVIVVVLLVGVMNMQYRLSEQITEVQIAVHDIQHEISKVRMVFSEINRI